MMINLLYSNHIGRTKQQQQQHTAEQLEPKKKWSIRRGGHCAVLVKVFDWAAELDYDLRS